MDIITRFETLDTSYVDLSALIHYLRQSNFTGRMRISFGQYEADVFLYGASAPSAWESDRASGLKAQGEAALERLLARSREPGGLITVYETSDVKSASEPEREQAADRRLC